MRAISGRIDQGESLMNDYEFRPNGSHGVTARRWVARLIDWVLVLVPTSLLWILSVHFLELQLVERTTDLPVAAVDALLREGWTGVQGEVVAAADEFRQTLAGIVVVTLLVQLLAVAIYDWACHGFFARTLGKAL
ncbi:MAG: hypothetical protein L0K86_20340, partial [Actinomycetia bacterium]|nr:hypothetical protein [Actinomycetes bacterium]